MSGAAMSPGQTAWDIWSRSSGLGLVLRGFGFDPFDDPFDVPQQKPPPVPDMADEFLKQMHRFDATETSARQQSFLGEPPRTQEQNKQRTILGGR